MGRKRGAGEGSIVQRKDGTWCAAMTVKQSGRRLYFYAKTRPEVQAKLQAALAEQVKGTLPEPNRMTVGEWVDIWLTKYKRRQLRLTTWDSYMAMARTHIGPELGNIRLRDLRPERIQSFYEGLLSKPVGKTAAKAGKRAVGTSDSPPRLLSARTVRYVHQVLHGALEQAVKNNLVARNVSDATTLPRLEKREATPLMPEEQNRLLAVLRGDRLGVAFLVLLGTGLRRGELLALSWDDVNVTDGTIRVRRNLVRTSEGVMFQPPKTPKSLRTVPVPPEIIDALKAHKAAQNAERLKAGRNWRDENLVFPTEVGTPMYPRNFDRHWEAVRQEAGIGREVSLHRLRHTYASVLLSRNVAGKVVQELLGHSSIGVTLDIYGHLLPGVKQEAIAVLNGAYGAYKRGSL